MLNPTHLIFMYLIRFVELPHHIDMMGRSPATHPHKRLDHRVIDGPQTITTESNRKAIFSESIAQGRNCMILLLSNSLFEFKKQCTLNIWIWIANTEILNMFGNLHFTYSSCSRFLCLFINHYKHLRAMILNHNHYINSLSMSFSHNWVGLFRYQLCNISRKSLGIEANTIIY